MSMITHWRGKWYFANRGAMVVGVPLRDMLTVLPASAAGEGGAWDALELVEDLVSSTIRSATARHKSAGTRLRALS